jgi:CheY-like chemotaxis protein
VTVTVELPIRAVVTLEGSTTRVDAADAPATDILQEVRVLVVDDEADARDLMSTVLREAGATVETASSSATGHAAFLRFRPQVVVSDVGMPEEDGLAFMRRIRALSEAEGGDVPAIALTAFAREEDRRRALRAGFSAHIAKPVEAATLVRAVANLVAESRAG